MSILLEGRLLVDVITLGWVWYYLLERDVILVISDITKIEHKMLMHI